MVRVCCVVGVGVVAGDVAAPATRPKHASTSGRRVPEFTQRRTFGTLRLIIIVEGVFGGLVEDAR